MAENEAEVEVPDGSSDRVLQGSGDESSVAVGEGLTIRQQLAELEELLRDAARRCDPRVGEADYYGAQKALHRCVDILKRYNDGA